MYTKKKEEPKKAKLIEIGHDLSEIIDLAERNLLERNMVINPEKMNVDENSSPVSTIAFEFLKSVCKLDRNNNTCSQIILGDMLITIKASPYKG